MADSVEQMDPPRAAEELRASFGDRKPPDISRKITACVACRKLKIKCQMPGSGAPPCTRCRKRGLSCVVNRSLQMLLEDNASWKQCFTSKVHALEDMMRDVSQQLAAVAAQQQRCSSSHEAAHTQPDSSVRPSPLPAHLHHNDDHDAVPEMRVEVDGGPATIPSSSMSGVGEPTSTHAARPQSADLISVGILSEDQAQELFDAYASRLDHYLYRILGSSATLAQTRASSPVLLAAVCTVGALHSAELGALFKPCYRHFRSISADLSLSREAGLDDIRGLCIGAFWLQDISWNLSSIAVSLATQQHLDRAPAPGNDGPRVAYDKLRLYYLVYICDHHFGIAYGRSPLTRESELIRSAKTLLSAPEPSEDDARLASQVEVWSIATRGLELLGLDVDSRLPAALLPRIRRLMIALDTWRADWNEGFGRSPHVGNYPRKGVKLHFHFARLYLCSHAFRGVDSAASESPSRTGPTTASPQVSVNAHGHTHTSPRAASSRTTSTGFEANPGQLSGDVEEIAAAAVDSAQSILRIITTDAEIQAHLNGLPLYFDTMIAFAIVFLYKVATKYSHVVRIDTAGTLNLVRDMASTLRSTTAGMHPQHLLVAISHAVDKISSQDQLLHGPADRDHVERLPTVDPTVPAYPAQTGCEMPDLDPGWALTDFDWTNYDFLSMGDSVTFNGFDLGFQ